MKLPFPEFKSQIDRRISKLLKEAEKSFVAGVFDRDSIRRLESFARRGKSLRGSLVMFSYRLFKNGFSQEALDMAAALELIHSALLIQDDIMDEDEMRRGVKAVHRQYAWVGKKLKIKNPDHFGESAAICLSDIAFFFAFGVLGRLKIDLGARRELWKLFSRELITTALGQMEDVAASPARKKELTLYLAKTARYTFVLPLLAGALLAGKRRAELKKFEKLGEVLGIIFQLKDDELDGEQKRFNKEISRFGRMAKKLIFSLSDKKQKEAFSDLLAYSLSREF